MGGIFIQNGNFSGGISKRKLLVIIFVAVGFVILSIVMMITKTVVINNANNRTVSADDSYVNPGIVEYIDDAEFEVPALEQIMGVWGCNEDNMMIEINEAGEFKDLTAKNNRNFRYDATDGFLYIFGGTGANAEYMLTTTGSLMRMTDSTSYETLDCYRRESYE